MLIPLVNVPAPALPPLPAGASGMPRPLPAIIEDPPRPPPAIIIGGDCAPLPTPPLPPPVAPNPLPVGRRLLAALAMVTAAAEGTVVPLLLRLLMMLATLPEGTGGAVLARE